MGPFDDLIPKPGLFDDLIPAGPTPDPMAETPAAPVQPDMLPYGVEDLIAPALLGEVIRQQQPDRPFQPQPSPAVVPATPEEALLGELFSPNVGAPIQPVSPPLSVIPPVPARPDGLPRVGAAPTPFDNEPLGDLLARRGQQAARGATEMIAAQPEAAAIRGAAVDAAQAAEAERFLTERAQMIAEMQLRLEDPTLAPEARSFIEQNLRDLEIGQVELDKRAGTEVVPAQDRQSFAMGDKIRQSSSDFFGEPDPRDESFWGKVAEGAGSYGGLIAAAAAGGAVGGPAGAFVAGGATGEGANRSQLYREAIEAGADEEIAQKAGRWGAVIGASEVVPITRAIKLLPPRMRGNVANRFLRKIGDIAQASGEEAAQEYAATVANNLVAQGYYDPERGWNEGAGEAALIGAILGGTVGAVVPSGEAATKPPESQEPPADRTPQIQQVTTGQDLPPVTPLPETQVQPNIVGTPVPPVTPTQETPFAPPQEAPTPPDATTPEAVPEVPAETVAAPEAPQATVSPDVRPWTGPINRPRGEVGSEVIPEVKAQYEADPVSFVAARILSDLEPSKYGGRRTREAMQSNIGIPSEQIGTRADDATIDAAIAGLEELGLIQKDGPSYVLTDAGKARFTSAPETVTWATVGGEVMANSPAGQLLSVTQQGGQFRAVVNGQEVGTAPTLQAAQQLATTEAARLNAAAEAAKPAPVETPMALARRTEQAMRAERQGDTDDGGGPVARTQEGDPKRSGLRGTRTGEPGPDRGGVEAGKRGRVDDDGRATSIGKRIVAAATTHLNEGLGDKNVSTTDLSLSAIEWSGKTSIGWGGYKDGRYKNSVSLTKQDDGSYTIDFVSKNYGENLMTPKGLAEGVSQDAVDKLLAEAEAQLAAREAERARQTVSMDPSDVFPAPDETINADALAADLETLSPAEAKQRLAQWKQIAKDVGKLKKHDNDVVMSLFDYTGSWSQPWRDAGYQVERYDTRFAQDNADYAPGDEKYYDAFERFPGTDAQVFIEDGMKITGVLAATPCTTFASSGAKWWDSRHNKKDKELVRKMFGDGAADMFDTPVEANTALVDVTAGTIDLAKPDWFVLENPIGRIGKMSGLPDPQMRFQPHNYGDPYTKRTQLWGKFNTDLPTANVKPTQGSKVHKMGSGDPDRSTTPEGFAYAFFIANDPDAQRMWQERSNVKTVKKVDDVGVLKEKVHQTRVSEPSPEAEPKTTGRTQPKGTLGPSFIDFSFTNKNSVFEAAFRDAGLEPDAARLLSVEEQISKLRGVIRAKYGLRIILPQKIINVKTITGRKRPELRDQIKPRDAIDQMLDAYRQLELMAHMMGIPNRALALKDKDGNGLALSMTAKLPGALGSYRYDPTTGERAIHLPGRSNSFAHEWGHALDHWLGLYLYEGTDKEVQQLLSTDMHEAGLDPAKTRSERVARRMVEVMQALFEDRAKMAAMQIELAQRATAVNAKGQPTADAKKAQVILDDIAKNKKPPKAVMNRYFQNAEEFDVIYRTGGYFQSPHEMLARAFESYIGSRAAGMSDLPAGFLHKPSWAYTGSEELRAKMTFPRGADALKIFNSFDNLAAELATAEIFGTDGAAKPEDNDVYDIRQWDHWKPKTSLLTREADVWKSAVKAKREIDQGPSAKQKTLDAIEYYASTFQGYLRGIAKRQETPEARRALQNVLDLFMTDPGSGRTVRGVWEEDVERESKRNTTRLENISKEFNLSHLSDDENAELRRLLTIPGYKTDDQNLARAAAALRRYMDHIWRYIDNSGVKVGYVRNGYLPRILNLNAMMERPNDFMTQAAKVYRLIFKRDVRDNPDIDEQIEDIKTIIRQLSRAKRPTAEGDEVVRDLIAIDPEAGDAVSRWMKARKKIADFNAKIKKAEKAEDHDKVAELEAQKVEFIEEEFMPAHEDLLDILQRIYATERADNWYYRSMSGNSMDFDTKGPSTTFLKRRELPSEADEFLSDFYQNDVMILIQDYAQMAPRRAEYVRRAGVNSDKLENMLDAAVRAGASSYDVKEIRRSINMLTGRQIDHQHSQSVWSGGWMYVAATVTLLRRAFFSSLAEPLTAGIRTGDVRDSFHALAVTFGGLVRTKKTRDLGEVARVVGLITSAEHETIMLNRYGGDIDPSRAQGKMLARFFRYTFLTQLTNLQRQQMLKVGDRVIRRHLRRAQKGDKFSIGELADLGIDTSEVNDLRDWLEAKPGVPTADDLLGVDGDYFNRAAELYAAAAARFANQVIQNPRRFTRPGAALDTKFRAMYGITGFIYSFHNNILLPLFKKNIGPRLESDGVPKFAARAVLGSSRNLMYAFPAMAALYGGQMLALLLRTALYNADKLEEFEDDDEMAEWLIAETVTRSGLLGAWDIPYNMYTSLKYGTDLAGFYAGPQKRYLLEQMEGVAMLGARNSPNTETAERNAIEAAARIMIDTGGTMLLSSLPGGPLAAPVYGTGIFAWDALSPAEHLAEAIFPDPKKK